MKLKLSGTFGPAYTQQKIDAAFKKFGAGVTVVLKANEAWDTLAATEEAFTRQQTAVVKEAVEKDLPILKSTWVIKCMDDKKFQKPSASDYHRNPANKGMLSPPASKEGSPETDQGGEGEGGEGEGGEGGEGEGGEGEGGEGEGGEGEGGKGEGGEDEGGEDEGGNGNGGKGNESNNGEEGNGESGEGGGDDPGRSASGKSGSTASSPSAPSTAPPTSAPSTSASSPPPPVAPSPTVDQSGSNEGLEEVDRSSLAKDNEPIRQKHLAQFKDARKLVLDYHPNDRKQLQKGKFELTIECQVSTGYLIVTDPKTSIRYMPGARAGYLLRVSDHVLAAQAFQKESDAIKPVSTKADFQAKPITEFVWWTVASNDRLCYVLGVVNGEQRPRLFTRTTVKQAFGGLADLQMNKIRTAFGQSILGAKKKAAKQIAKVN